MFVETWILKVLLVRVQKEVRRMVEETFIILPNIWVVIGRMLVDIRMLKMLLVGTETQ